MKIIIIDNFDRESVCDALIAENLNKYYANLIVEFLNEKVPLDGAILYKAVPDNYELYKFKP